MGAVGRPVREPSASFSEYFRAMRPPLRPGSLRRRQKWDISGAEFSVWSAIGSIAVPGSECSPAGALLPMASGGKPRCDFQPLERQQI
jgi:hypothetical protein